jgi:hypothetical protein
MAPLPEVGNPISGTAFTIHFFRFLAWATVQSRTCALFYIKLLDSTYNRKALRRSREKKIKRILAAAAVVLAWQRSGGGDTATAVAARQQRRWRRGGRGGSG